VTSCTVGEVVSTEGGGGGGGEDGGGAAVDAAKREAKTFILPDP